MRLPFSFKYLRNIETFLQKYLKIHCPTSLEYCGEVTGSKNCQVPCIAFWKINSFFNFAVISHHIKIQKILVAPFQALLVCNTF